MRAHSRAAATALCLWWVHALAAAMPPLEPAGHRMQGQADAGDPASWRPLSAAEKRTFDLGYRVFNTEWVPADSPAGRIDGLGPLFNAASCDACHNSRRRGRGPAGDGELPADVVVQLGRLQADGTVIRGTYVYGYVLNTAAITGYQREGRASVSYRRQVRRLADGSEVELREPLYAVDDLAGPPLASSTVLMPRLPPNAQGSGLLELVPQEELEHIVAEQRSTGGTVHGRISWLSEGAAPVIGRLGWQASEPSVASQVSVAFAREMGLSNPLLSSADCGTNTRCRAAPTGGSPEVEPELFDAVVTFERLQAAPAPASAPPAGAGAQLFSASGCAVCHRTTLRTSATGPAAEIHAYTDLLLHDLGEGLADRTLAGRPASAGWRTAPLWGLNAAYASGHPVRLLHDGRARSVEEAILWHAGEAQPAQQHFAALSSTQRQALVRWVESL